MSKKYKNGYIEMPAKEFLLKYPEAAFIPVLKPLIKDLMTDDNYIVRFKSGRIEIGYTSDAWLIRN